MSIIRPRLWTQQPQVPVEVDWGNALCRGLVGGFNSALGGAGAIPSVINKSLMQIAGGVRSVNANGVSLSGSGNWTVSGDIAPTQNSAFLIVTVPASITTTQVHLANIAGAGEWIGIQSSQWKYSANAGINAVSGVPNIVIFNRPTATTTQIHVNGVAGTPATFTPSWGANTYKYGSYGGSSYPVLGSTNLLLIWARALSPQEIASLSANPWQIFAPRVT